MSLRGSIFGIGLLALFNAQFALAETRLQGHVVTASWADLNGDGRNDSIEVVLEHGDMFESMWLGRNALAHRGEFSVRVALSGAAVVTTPLNPHFFSDSAPQPLLICAKSWSLQLRDFNADGRLDFSVGQWGTGNGHVYRLFEIETSGRVAPLRIPHDELFVATLVNSTAEILAAGGRLRWAAFANSCDGDNACGWHVNEAVWNSASRMFEPGKSQHVGSRPSWVGKTDRGGCF